MKAHLNKITVFGIFILVVLYSCERKALRKLDDISKFSHFTQINNDTGNMIRVRVIKIIIEEADKRRNGLVINPDETKVKIEISIENRSKKIVHLPTRIGNELNTTLFYGYFRTHLDSIKFINSRLADSLIINIDEKLDISFVSSFYDFERLFEKKVNYTNDMIKLVNGIYFKYFINRKNDSIINFIPDKKTLLFKKNTY